MMRMMHGADLAGTTIAVGVLLTLAFGMVAGHRAHRWLWFYAPRLEELLPTDAGALVGLSVAIALLAA